MKYIDAEKLIAEIKGKIAELESEPTPADRETILLQMCKINAFREVLSVINRIGKNTLQQEQKEPTCKSCGFYENNCPFIRNTFKPYPNRVCKDYTYSVMKEQEQPEADLEEFDKDVTKIWGKCAAEPNDSITCFHIETFNEVARHFYELGLNARKQ